MPTEKKLTFLIPTYNAEKTICRCLDSLINAGPKELFSILLYDDGSSDNTLDVVRKQYKNSEALITIIEGGTNKGVTQARKRLINEATTEYIFFVDSDDYLINQESIFHYLNKESSVYDYIQFQMYKEYDGEREILTVQDTCTDIPGEATWTFFDRPIEKPDSIHPFLANSMIRTAIAQTAVTKIDMCPDIYEDTFFTLCLFPYIRLSRIDCTYTYVYTTTEGSLSRNADKQVKSSRELLKAIEGFPDARKHTADLQKTYLRIFGKTQVGAIQLFTRTKNEALSLYDRSISIICEFKHMLEKHTFYQILSATTKLAIQIDGNFYKHCIEHYQINETDYTAWKKNDTANKQAKQKEADTFAYALNQQLRGQNVLFYGYGAAYHHYRPYFTQVNIKGILVDKRYSPDVPKTADGIALIQYTELSRQENQLSIIICCRDEFSALMQKMLEYKLPCKSDAKIHVCPLHE